ncbi:hypothetical protein D3C87_1844980 [compost metagenome]
MPICIQSVRSCSRLTVSGVGSRPSGVFTNSGSSNQSRSFASDLLTADGVTFMRFAALVTLRSCSNSCRHSNRLRSRLLMGFFIVRCGLYRHD